jgi:hypothetical protein
MGTTCTVLEAPPTGGWSLFLPLGMLGGHVVCFDQWGFTLFFWDMTSIKRSDDKEQRCSCSFFVVVLNKTFFNVFIYLLHFYFIFALKEN